MALESFFAASGLSHSMRQTAIAGDPTSQLMKPLQPCSLAPGVSTEAKLIVVFGGRVRGGGTMKSPRSCSASARVSSRAV